MSKWKRLKEPSTWTALAVLMAAFGVPNADGMAQGLGAIASGVFALMGVFMPETGGQ